MFVRKTIDVVQPSRDAALFGRLAKSPPTVNSLYRAKAWAYEKSLHELTRNQCAIMFAALSVLPNGKADAKKSEDDHISKASEESPGISAGPARSGERGVKQLGGRTDQSPSGECFKPLTKRSSQSQHSRQTPNDEQGSARRGDRTGRFNQAHERLPKTEEHGPAMIETGMTSAYCAASSGKP